MADTLDLNHFTGSFFMGEIDEMEIGEAAFPDEDITDLSATALGAMSSRTIRPSTTAAAIQTLTSGGLSGLESLLYVGENLPAPLVGLELSWKKLKKGLKKAVKYTPGYQAVKLAAKVAKYTPQYQVAKYAKKIGKKYWAGPAAAAGANVLRPFTPTVKITPAAIRQTQAVLGKKLAARRTAIVRAQAGLQQSQARVVGIEGQLATAIAQMAAAKRQGRTGRVEVLGALIEKLRTAQAGAVNTALRFAKTQAVATVLAKNTATEQQLITMAGTLAAKGDPGATVLTAAAKGIEHQSQQLLDARKEQVAQWGATPASQAPLPSEEPSVAPEAGGEPEAGDESATAEAGAPAEEAAAEAGSGNEGEGGGEGGGGAEGGGEGETEFEGLEYGWKDFRKAAGKIKKIPGVGKALNKIKKGIGPIANAAKDLLQKAACPLVKNPAVMQAIAGAVTGVAGGPVAGAAAAKAIKSGPVKSLLAKACPAGKKAEKVTLPTGQTATVELAPPAESKGGMGPAVLAIPAAALLLL